MEPAHRGAVAIMALIGGACGPSSPEPGGGGTESGPTSSASATGVQTSTSSSTVMTTPATMTATSDGGDIWTGDDGGTSTAGPGTCADDGGYRAALIIGGIDRIRIFHRDDAAGTCTWLTLAGIGAGGSPYEVSATAPWELEAAAWNDVPASCDDDFPGQSGDNLIPDAFGTIDLNQASPQQPCFIDLDLSLQLLENPDPPVFVELCRSDLEVGSCLG